MHTWPLDFLRELRFWHTNDCLISLPLLLLVSGLAWFLGLLTGGFLAVLVLSPSCRRLLVLALHSIIGLIAPAPGPGGQDLRIRLAGYRTHTA
jgi:hypothetical protein